MPIIRKVIQIGKAQAVSLPKQWVEWVERKSGQRLREVLIEIDDKLVIIPLTEGKQNGENH